MATAERARAVAEASSFRTTRVGTPTEDGRVNGEVAIVASEISIEIGVYAVRTVN